MSEQAVEHDHFSHYKASKSWETGITTMTCVECGHEWTSPAPPYEVEIRFKIEAEATVDLVRYYTGLSESGRKEYRAFELDESEYAPWERPLAFLMQDKEEDVCGGISVVPHRPFGERGMPQPVREDVSMEDWPEARVTRRPAGAAYERGWTEEDFNGLLGLVDWLRKVHEIIDAEDEVDEEDLARIPGPLDIPISFKED